MYSILYFPAIILLSYAIQFRLRNSLFDGDFAALHYPGFFRRNGRCDLPLRDLIGSPGNKTFVQYLNGFLYGLLGSDIARVRQCYSLWSGLTACLLFIVLRLILASSLPALLGALFFILWANHPALFAHFENAERYALLHSMLHMGLLLVANSRPELA